MWGKQGSIEVIDIGNDFFIVKFFSQEDLDFALTGGPWKIFDHYLAIRPWKPNFNPVEATVDTIAAWVRLPGLAIEYYDEEMLKKIGNVIGQTMKVDVNTAEKSRGKFARLCVQLDLTAPLVAQYSINGVKYGVEYEGLYNICFACGMVGHEQNNCPKKVTVEETQKDPQAAMEEGTRVEKTGSGNDGKEKGNTGIGTKEKGKKVIGEGNSAYGPWMTVQQITRGKRAAKQNTEASSGGKGETSSRNTIGENGTNGTRYHVLRNMEGTSPDDHNTDHANHLREENVTSKGKKNNTEKTVTVMEQHQTKPFNQKKPQANKNKQDTKTAQPKEKTQTINPKQKNQNATQQTHPKNPIEPQQRMTITQEQNNLIPASLDSKNTPENHPRCNTYEPQSTHETTMNTPQDAHLEQEIVPETIQGDEIMEEVMEPDPKPPDLNSIETEVMLEAIMKYEEQQQLSHKMIEDELQDEVQEEGMQLADEEGDQEREDNPLND
ncbi:uncharacterized protein LOC107627827 [Arachis ipaensis]|uniref:uncharacterized protein LOC107627827 n=1 Tax=Arachis ipaensis TaxID=130454 RepID=UPI0007AF0652|nr:uncharacterized protein LOC107627827 [Arachis ipaensis]